MNYIQFKTSLADFPVFSISDIRAADPKFDRRRLTEWQHKGYIRKIIKGHYIFSDRDTDENLLFKIANKIYRPSYISFETALAHYQLIPEMVYTITSVATRRTRKFETPLCAYSYRTIHRRLFFGYLIRPNQIKIASAEKAILDYFYINTALRTRDDFASLRISKDVFSETISKKQFRTYLSRFNQKTLSARAEKFLEWMDQNG
jgi:predicted transcriptional regulator of viral defense system